MFELGKDFANADTIVIAAPYYDLSFPVMLKQYFEQINVLGLTFTYSESGVPEGLCRAKSLYYVTTAGGSILSDDFGFGYVKALANTFYGINEVYQIKAEGLDIIGADVDRILSSDRIYQCHFDNRFSVPCNLDFIFAFAFYESQEFREIRFRLSNINCQHIYHLVSINVVTVVTIVIV